MSEIDMPENDLTPELIDDIDRLIDGAGIAHNRTLIRRILTSGLQFGMDDTDRLDLKITSAALIEMRNAFRLFAPYSDVRKVTIFGSARTKPDSGDYRAAHDVAAALAKDGWMVVTGAGPGIMQAAAEGAGPDMSIGVSIRLPFEEKANDVIGQDPKHVAMKYFFTRKLMLVKESTGFICVPGGFGTLDEMFELLTLQQTGKAEPVPIVLLDEPGGAFWKNLEHYIRGTMMPAGVISADDLDRVLITDSVEEAHAAIVNFWHNYDSLRWVGDTLVLRLKHTPTDEETIGLNEQFAFLVKEGELRRVEPFAPERTDNDKLDLPRIALVLNQFKVGSLFQLVNAINALPSAH